MLGRLYQYLPRAIGMHTPMIQETARHQQPDTLYQLYDLWMIDHRHIEHAVIRHSIRSLSVTGTATDTEGHHLTIDDIVVDLQFHLILHPVEEHHKQ